MQANTATADIISFPQPKREPKRRIKTANSIPGLKAPKTGVDEYVVDDCRGLRLRITAADVRSWSFRYSNPQGVMSRMHVGLLKDVKLDDAKKLVSKYRTMLDAVPPVDPKFVREEKREAVTFETMARRWKTEYAEAGTNTKNKGKDEMLMLEQLFPVFGSRVAEDVTSEGVGVDYHTPATKLALARGMKGTYPNRVCGTASTVYNWGIEQKLVTHNPFKHYRKLNTEESRDRVLEPAELRRVWEAASALPLHQRIWFRLRMVVPNRGGELLRMRWEDIDWESNWWTLPGKFAKNGKDHEVYLGTLARELLAELPRRAEDGVYDPTWVFPAGDYERKDGKGIVKGANTAAVNVIPFPEEVAEWLSHPERANIVTKRDVPTKRDDWTKHYKAGFTGHDLRRTISTLVSEGGASPIAIAKLLNHTKKKKSDDVDDVTWVYIRNKFRKEKAAVLDFWERQLRVVLAGKNIEEAGQFAELDAATKALFDTVKEILDGETLSARGRGLLVALTQRYFTTA